MEPNLKDEQEIIWLQPKERYAYLRETTTTFSQRRCFPKRMRPSGQNTDGGAGTHLVAYAVLKPDALSSLPGCFERRYWWVKKYDRFDGHGTDRAGTFYDTGGPCEAVKVGSVTVGQPSELGWDNNWTALEA